METELSFQVYKERTSVGVPIRADTNYSSGFVARDCGSPYTIDTGVVRATRNHELRAQPQSDDFVSKKLHACRCTGENFTFLLCVRETDDFECASLIFLVGFKIRRRTRVALQCFSSCSDFPLLS